MSYTITDLNAVVSVAPKQLNPDLNDTVKTLLQKKVEGTIGTSFNRLHGMCEYIYSVLSSDKVPNGVVTYSGNVSFDIRYVAHVYTVAGGDVIDTNVLSVTSHGVLCVSGPVEIFVSAKNMPTYYAYHSTVNIKEWISPDKIMKIRAGMRLRIRVIDIKWNNDEIFAVGTLLGDSLGPLDYTPN